MVESALDQIFQRVVISHNADPTSLALGKRLMKLMWLVLFLALVNFVIITVGGVYIGVVCLFVPLLIALCGFQGVQHKHFIVRHQMLTCFSTWSALTSIACAVFGGLAAMLLVALFQFRSSDCGLERLSDGSKERSCVCVVAKESVRWDGEFTPCATSMMSIRLAVAASALCTLLMATIYCAGFKTARMLSHQNAVNAANAFQMPAAPLLHSNPNSRAYEQPVVVLATVEVLEPLPRPPATLTVDRTAHRTMRAEQTIEITTVLNPILQLPSTSTQANSGDSDEKDIDKSIDTSIRMEHGREP